MPIEKTATMKVKNVHRSSIYGNFCRPVLWVPLWFSTSDLLGSLCNVGVFVVVPRDLLGPVASRLSWFLHRRMRIFPPWFSTSDQLGSLFIGGVFDVVPVSWCSPRPLGYRRLALIVVFFIGGLSSSWLFLGLEQVFLHRRLLRLVSRDFLSAWSRFPW